MIPIFQRVLPAGVVTMTLAGLSSPGLSSEDAFNLRRSIELAAEARGAGRHPFGALIVNAAGEVIVEARNNAVLLCCGEAGFRAGACRSHALHQHRAMCHVRRSHLLEWDWAGGLCPTRARAAALHRQSRREPHAGPAMPRSFREGPADCGCRGSIHGGRSRKGPRGVLDPRLISLVRYPAGEHPQ